MMLLDLTNGRKQFQSLTEGHSRSWGDEHARVTPGGCDTIIRKALEELFISSAFCGSNLHKQLLLTQVGSGPSWINPWLALQARAASPGALQPPRDGRREYSASPRLQGAGRQCHKLAGSLSEVAGLCQIILLSLFLSLPN